MHIICMFFTVRNRSNHSRKQGASNSKDSFDSVNNRHLKKKPKVTPLTAAQLELRMAIEHKYSKSKNLNQQYEIKSDDSAEMQEYKALKNERYIDLKQYHRHLSHSQTIQKRYLIRIKNSGNKRTSINAQALAEFSPASRNPFTKKQQPPKLNRFNDKFVFEERKTLSDDKKIRDWKNLGFDWRSASKKLKNQSVSPSQPFEKTHYFRKPQKSKRVLASQLSSK